MGACVPLWPDNGLIEGRRAHVGALIARPSRQCGVGMREGTPGESGGKGESGEGGEEGRKRRSVSDKGGEKRGDRKEREERRRKRDN